MSPQQKKLRSPNMQPVVTPPTFSSEDTIGKTETEDESSSSFYSLQSMCSNNITNEQERGELERHHQDEEEFEIKAVPINTTPEKIYIRKSVTATSSPATTGGSSCAGNSGHISGTAKKRRSPLIHSASFSSATPLSSRSSTKSNPLFPRTPSSSSVTTTTTPKSPLATPAYMLTKQHSLTTFSPTSSSSSPYDIPSSPISSFNNSPYMTTTKKNTNRRKRQKQKRRQLMGITERSIIYWTISLLIILASFAICMVIIIHSAGPNTSEDVEQPSKNNIFQLQRQQPEQLQRQRETTTVSDRSLRTIKTTSISKQQQPSLSIINTTSSSSTTWEYGDVVHVIQTRIMQNQPNLLHLGLARLNIFREFCLPTIVHQTEKNFLWIIRTDPDLHPTLRIKLIDILKPYAPTVNIVLISSNKNPEGFRHLSLSHDFHTQRTTTTNNTALLRGGESSALQTPTANGDGSTNDDNGFLWSSSSNNSDESPPENLIQKYLDASQTRILLESRLDADDGLHRSFVERIQKQALENLKSENNGINNTADDDEARETMQRDDNNDSQEDDDDDRETEEQSKEGKKWLVWCTYSQLEWQISSPWVKENTFDISPAEGYVVAVQKRECITPGLTMGYGVGTHRSDIPHVKHALLHRTVPPCDGSSSKETKTKMTTHCRLAYGVKFPGALRARTPTSAGMKDVYVLNHGDRKKYSKSKFQSTKQDYIWNGLTKQFHVSKDNASRLRSYIIDNLSTIASDNLLGQCTDGHSCKKSSKKVLHELMETKTTTTTSASTSTN